MSSNLDSMIGLIPLTIGAGLVMKVSDRMLGQDPTRGRRRRPKKGLRNTYASQARANRQKLASRISRSKMNLSRPF